MKKCRICKEFKNLEDFGIKVGNKDGRDTRCKKCKQVLHKEHGEAHPFRRLHISKKAKCKFNNIEYNLNEKILRELWTGECPIFNIPITLKESQLDRIVPSKGYIKGNVVFLCARANRLKSDGTSDELRSISEWLYIQEKEEQ